MVLVDTTVWIDFFAGLPNTFEKFLEHFFLHDNSSLTTVPSQRQSRGSERS